MHYFLTVPTDKALEVITAIVNNSQLTKITSIVSKEAHTLVFFDSQYTKRYLCCASGLTIFDYNLQTVTEAYNYASDNSMHDMNGIFDDAEDPDYDEYDADYIAEYDDPNHPDYIG